MLMAAACRGQYGCIKQSKIAARPEAAHSFLSTGLKLVCVRACVLGGLFVAILVVLLFLTRDSGSGGFCHPGCV